jgi:hypothetical protein
MTKRRWIDEVRVSLLIMFFRRTGFTISSITPSVRARADVRACWVEMTTVSM